LSLDPSVDLTLDPILSFFDTGTDSIKKIIDPTHPTFDVDEVLDELTDCITIDEANGYDLPVHRLVLGWTAEYVHLPIDSRLAARIEGKSSLSRIGVGVHITAPTIHAGFDGQIRLEIINHGYLPVTLKAGMRICQLIFEATLGTPERGYKGKFSGQKIQIS
jgi:dCTP deaminase